MSEDILEQIKGAKSNVVKNITLAKGEKLFYSPVLLKFSAGGQLHTFVERPPLLREGKSIFLGGYFKTSEPELIKKLEKLATNSPDLCRADG